MRASHLALLCLLGVVCTTAAPPEWTCSPPNIQNPFCPAKYQGNNQCNTEFCLPYAGCTAEDCNTIQGNIEAAKIIALDAYVVKGDRCVLSAVSAPECCNLCKVTQGCNAWSYCNKAAGCGSGCSQEVHGFDPALLSVFRNDIDIRDSPNRLNPAHKCTAAGAWPYGMCTLKVVAPEATSQQGNVTLMPGNQDGWISGMPTVGAPAWHEQTGAARVVTPARALPGATGASTHSQVAADTPQDPAAAAAAPPVQAATPEEQDHEISATESAAGPGHTSSDTQGHTGADVQGHTMKETPEGTLTSAPRGQQFPEGDLQYLNYEIAPVQPGVITGPQDVQYHRAQPSPPPSPPAAAAAVAPPTKSAGNGAGIMGSSRLGLLIAGLLIVIALM